MNDVGTTSTSYRQRQPQDSSPWVKFSHTLQVRFIKKGCFMTSITKEGSALMNEQPHLKRS